MHITVTTETGKIINLNVRPDEEVKEASKKKITNFSQLKKNSEICCINYTIKLICEI